MKWSLFLLIFFAACISMAAQTDCAYKGNGANYLLGIKCTSDFNYLKGRPLTEKFGYAASIKIVYSISDETVYFTNSNRFPFHFEFCTVALGIKDDLEDFNSKNYKAGRNREFILCNLNYYSHLDMYALEFMAEDDTPPLELEKLFNRIAALTYFSGKIRLLISTPELAAQFTSQTQIPIINPDEIYHGRQFSSLNKGTSYGYLKMVDNTSKVKYSFDKRDIVLLNGLPNELTAVAGVLTVPFQTPLCHISLLCKNRGTPNAVYRKAWTDSNLLKYVGRLVRYEVTSDTFYLRLANESDAKAYWKRQDKRKPINLAVDTISRQLIPVEKIGISDVSKVGGKAAHFGELTKVRVNKNKLRLPECGIAIPFYYYAQHLRENSISPLVDSLLVLKDPISIQIQLKKIRDAIKAAPVNSSLLIEVIHLLKSYGSDFVNFRFRSSTNAEDVKGFNGAGLYESKTGSLADSNKPIEKAIKGVWASLWEDRAFAERQFFKINQRTVAMGILVHRAFGEELSNGVAVTRHLYRDNYPAYTFNIQVGEVSVVSPPDKVTCDELIVSLGEVTGSKKISVEYLGRSNLSKDKPVFTLDQLTELTLWLTAIKKHFYRIEKSKASSYWNYTMDVEFKIDAFTGLLYVKQAREL